MPEDIHDGQCESEWESGAMAYTPCGCEHRRVNLGTCSMCDSRQATKVYGLPVCSLCYDGLVDLGAHLEEMEADDPALKQLGENVERSARKYLAEREGGSGA